MEKEKRNYLVIIVVFATMLAISVSENSKGVFVPLFKETFNINDASIGVAFFFISLSYVIGTYIAGHLIDIISRKNTMIIGSICMIIGTYIIAVSKSLFLFYLSFIISNLGMAFLALAVNTLIPTLNVKSTAVIMNLVHFSYGIGATVTHKSCGILLDKGLSYGEIYYIILGLTALLFILVLFSKFKNDSPKKDKVKIKFHKGEKTLILIMALGLGLYVAAEIQTGNWFVDYIKSSFGYSENKASNYSALFFLFFTVGRLFGGLAAEKIGYLKSVIISILIATVLYFTGLSLKENGLYLISISGIFFSIVFPIVILSVNDFFKESLNRASGIVITIASGTNMIMGFVIGYMAKILGIQNAMYIIPILLLISATLIFTTSKKGYSLIEKNEN